MFSWGELFSTFLVRKIMRVEGTCCSANGGGGHFLQALHIAGIPFVLCAFICSLPSLMLPAFRMLQSPDAPAFHRGKFSANQGKTWQK